MIKKPKGINEDFWNKLSETGKANLLKSMLNFDNDEIETNKYGRWQLKRFAEDIDDKETKQSVLHIFQNSKAINTSNLSYFGDTEDEGFINKTEQILDDIYYSKENDCYILLYKAKEKGK